MFKALFWHHSPYSQTVLQAARSRVCPVTDTWQSSEKSTSGAILSSQKKRKGFLSPPREARAQSERETPHTRRDYHTNRVRAYETSLVYIKMAAFAMSSQVANLASGKWVRGGSLSRVSARQHSVKPVKCVTVASIRQQGATKEGTRQTSYPCARAPPSRSPSP